MPILALAPSVLSGGQPSGQAVLKSLHPAVQERTSHDRLTGSGRGRVKVVMGCHAESRSGSTMLASLLLCLVGCGGYARVVGSTNRPRGLEDDLPEAAADSLAAPPITNCEPLEAKVGTRIVPANAQTGLFSASRLFIRGPRLWIQVSHAGGCGITTFSSASEG
jgi:hypothetical protein